MSQIDSKRVERYLQGRVNPIKGLKPEKLARILDDYHRGWLKEGAILWEAMKRRDLLLCNVAAKRESAVSRAQYEILTVAKSDRALFHKQILEKFYDNLVATDLLRADQRGGVDLLRRQMMDAVSKGYAVHEIIWKPFTGEGTQRVMGKKVRRSANDKGQNPNAKNASLGADVEDQAQDGEWLTAEFKFVPLWFFENTTGKLRYLKDEGATTGEELKEGEWMVTVGDCVMEACSVAYMFKHFSLKDWLAYGEKFGIPGVHGKTSAAKDSPEWEQMEEAVARFMNDFGCVTGADGMIELIETKGGGSGNLPMPGLVEYMDRAIAAVYRGADLSTISKGGEATGASLQGDESDLLQEDDAKKITETLWRIDKLVIQHVCGDEEPLAYFQILPPKKQAVAQDISIDSFLTAHGVPLSMDDAYERYGRPMPQENDALLSAPVQGNSSTEENEENEQRDAAPHDLENESRLVTSAATRMKEAKRRADEPLLKELLRIRGIANAEEQRNALRGFLAGLGGMKRLHAEAAEREVAPVLEDGQTEGMISGFEAARLARKVSQRRSN